MVDSHSLNSISAPTSSFNFKSGDISGTAAKTSDEKMGQGNEYYAQYREEEMFMPDERFVDRSAQLRATLNSLAMMNVANIIKTTKKPKALEDDIELEEDEKEDDEILDSILNSKNKHHHEDYEESPED